MSTPITEFIYGPDKGVQFLKVWWRDPEHSRLGVSLMAESVSGELVSVHTEDRPASWLRAMPNVVAFLRSILNEIDARDGTPTPILWKDVEVGGFYHLRLGDNHRPFTVVRDPTDVPIVWAWTGTDYRRTGDRPLDYIEIYANQCKDAGAPFGVYPDFDRSVGSGEIVAPVSRTKEYLAIDTEPEPRDAFRARMEVTARSWGWEFDGEAWRFEGAPILVRWGDKWETRDGFTHPTAEDAIYHFGLRRRFPFQGCVRCRDAEVKPSVRGS